MADWADICRRILQIGAGIWIQSAFLLSAGLAAGWLLRRRGPLFEAAAYRATLCAVLLSAFLTITLAGRIRPVWRIGLPFHAPARNTAPLSPLARIGSKLPPPAKVRVALPPLATSDRLLTHGAPRMALPTHGAARIADARRAGGETFRQREAPAGAAISGWPLIYLGSVAIWLTVCLAQLIWLVLGGAALRRIARLPEADKGSREAKLLADLAARAGVSVPRLIVHPRIRSPFAAGIFRPMIVSPACLRDFAEPVARAVLSHELAHLAQRDSAWLPLFKAALALGWPQPLLRVLHRRWLSASEYACDVWALGQGCSPEDYARCLVSLAERRPRFQAAHVLSLGMAPMRSLLGRRIQQILGWSGARARPVSPRARYAMAAVAILIGCAVAGLVSSSTDTLAAGRRFTRHTASVRPPLREQPVAAFPQSHSVAAIRRGGSMKRLGSRMLSTVAAVTGGLVQVSLPPAAVSAPAEQAPVAASVPVSSPAQASSALTVSSGVRTSAGASNAVTLDSSGLARTSSADSAAAETGATAPVPVAIPRVRSAPSGTARTLALPGSPATALPETNSAPATALPGTNSAPATALPGTNSAPASALPSAIAIPGTATQAAPVTSLSNDGTATTLYLPASPHAVPAGSAAPMVPVTTRSADRTTTIWLPAPARVAAPSVAASERGFSAATPDIYSRLSTQPSESSPAWDGKISMDLHHAPVDDALRSLFRQSGRSFSLPDGISGTVTVEASAVSFDTALKMIMRSSSHPLSYEKEDGVYYFRSAQK